jgi:hypothetical protein
MNYQKLNYIIGAFNSILIFIKQYDSLVLCFDSCLMLCVMSLLKYLLQQSQYRIFIFPS